MAGRLLFGTDRNPHGNRTFASIAAYAAVAMVALQSRRKANKPIDKSLAR
jgi:hypothetical protein